MSLPTKSAGLEADVFDFADRISSFRTVGELFGALAKSYAKAGVDYFLFVRGARIEETIVGGVGHRGDMEAYFPRRSYDYDPVIPAAVKAMAPVAWSEVAAGPRLDPRQKRIYRDHAAAGMREGLCIPMVGAGRSMIIANCGGYDVDTSVRVRASMHAMALYANYAVGKLSGGRRPEKPALTEREKDCLLWIAKGKTDWEIGCILGIGESTVHWYVEGAKRKMGTATRMQAVVEAIYDAVILP